MRTFIALQIIVITLIIFVKSGKSLKCYVCRSDNYTECGTDKTHIEDCLGKENMPPLCRKITQRMTFKKENDYTMIRECGFNKNPDDCYKLNWSRIADQETCECHADLCNRGHRAVFNLLATFIFWCLDFFPW